MQVGLFKDYAPNGLQVEGKEEIAKVATSVTASKAAIDFAAGQGADLLLVHHGMFWKSEPVTITGWKKARIETLLQHQIKVLRSIVSYNHSMAIAIVWKHNIIMPPTLLRLVADTSLLL